METSNQYISRLRLKRKIKQYLSNDDPEYVRGLGWDVESIIDDSPAGHRRFVEDEHKLNKAKFTIDVIDGVDYVIPINATYKVRVIRAAERPQSYEACSNQVIGACLSFQNDEKLLGMKDGGSSALDFEFIGISLLNEQGLLMRGAYESAIDYYCYEKYGYEVEGYMPYNYDFGY